MEQAPLISIIMPVYNAGVLLHTAVESVLRQSFAARHDEAGISL